MFPSANFNKIIFQRVPKHGTEFGTDIAAVFTNENLKKKGKKRKWSLRNTVLGRKGGGKILASLN
jgi:hypothetical protein